MKYITKAQIDIALPKIGKGYDQYLLISKRLSICDVSTDLEFQKKFNSFYRITPFRNKEWQKSFYTLLEKYKKEKKADFEIVLNELYKSTGKWEGSFVSKLVHSVHPDKPVIDKWVRENLNLFPISATEKDKSLKLVEQYKAISDRIQELLQSEEGQYLVKRFKETYPNSNVTEIKMVDFVLWQIRR